jgi:hypothetical protein
MTYVHVGKYGWRISMADHVARMAVQLADEASSNANQVAQSLDLVGTSADKATAATVDVSAATKDFGNTVGDTAPALGNVSTALQNYSSKITDYINLSGTLDSITKSFQDGLAAVREEFTAGNATLDETTAKEAQLTATRDNATQSAKKQSQAFADNRDVQSTATDSATTSSDKLNDSTGNLAEREIALYTAISGGKAAVTAMIENMVKSTATSTDAAGSTGVLAGAFAALLSPIGLAATSRGIGCNDYATRRPAR